MNPLRFLFSLLAIYGLALVCETSAPSNRTSSSTFVEGSSFDCIESRLWTKPHWPYNVVDIFYSITLRLRNAYVHPSQGQEFEFLPNGEVPVFGLPVVRTPFKIALGEVGILFFLQSPFCSLFVQVIIQLVPARDNRRTRKTFPLGRRPERLTGR